jgi:hypothetical protein
VRRQNERVHPGVPGAHVVAPARKFDNAAAGEIVQQLLRDRIVLIGFGGANHDEVQVGIALGEPSRCLKQLRKTFSATSRPTLPMMIFPEDSLFGAGAK